jgi:D-glycero-alpha-D-manno-heptose 1-phosphate guanylyltransferase
MMQVPDTLILCGGLGTRLRPLTYSIQKCMLPVYKIPLLDYIVQQIKYLDLEKIIFACGHRKESIIEHFGPEYIYSCPTEFINTGARIKKALNLVTTENLIVFNGDSYCNIDRGCFWEVYKQFIKSEVDVCKILVNKRNSLLSSYIDTSIENYFGAGIYFLKKKYLKNIEYKDDLSLESDIGPNSDHMFVELSDEFFVVDIGTPENYKKVNDGRNKWGRFFKNFDREPSI